MFQTMDEVRRANRDAGYHWFSGESDRFFRTRYESGLMTVGGRQFFITSEQREHDSERRFTVRKVCADGAISTVGKFMEYASLHEAMDGAFDIAASANVPWAVTP